MSSSGDLSAAALADTLGHRFARPDLLAEALAHASAGSGRDYQRLEFLGDRVLGLVIAEHLLERFPTASEGDLTPRLVALVRQETLAEIGAALGLGAHILTSPGEAGAGVRASPAILADIVEAIIAALYLDGGLAAARAFILRHWAALVDTALPPRDAKTALQEWAQARRLPLPSYRVAGRTGPDHAPEFTVEASVRGQPPATAAGPSKREAEQRAASLLLATLGEPSDG
ncbi:MAG: ribonuclease III [Alphaproteobacteria bacterium]